MSATSSPKKLHKKQSLSILSSSHVNQLNNSLDVTSQPRKERIVSESTGLIKFSLQKPNNLADKENVSYHIQNSTSAINNSKTASPERETTCIPIYVPIDESKVEKCIGSTEDILFQMASKQRNILDLEQQLKQANQELADLEKIYHKLSNNNNEIVDIIPDTKPLSTPQRLASVAQTIRKSTSLMNINLTAPKINEDLAKTQKQMTDTFNQFTNNISKNNFFSKSRSFLESNFQQKVQKGNEILNSIFEKSESSDNDTSIDGVSEAFDYSVDMDLNRLSSMKVSQKYRKSILDDLEDVDEESEQSHDELKRTSTSVSSFSDEDYGGETVAI